MKILKKLYPVSLIAILVLYFGGSLTAQDMPPPPDEGDDAPAMQPGFNGRMNRGEDRMRFNPRNADPLRLFRFHPEMIMKLQKELDLTDTQKESIKKQIKEAQHQFIDMQFKLQQQMEELGEILNAEEIDDDAALKKLDSVLKVEAEIKKTRLALALKIKNELTQEQVTKLKELRQDRREKRMEKRSEHKIRGKK